MYVMNESFKGCTNNKDFPFPQPNNNPKKKKKTKTTEQDKAANMRGGGDGFGRK